MREIFTPEVLVVIAGSSFVLGYLIINQVYLRVFMLIGTGLYVCYYATVAAEPLWEAIYTSTAMGLANVIGLFSLLARKSRIVIPARHRDIYPRFQTLPPGDFRTLVTMARRFVAEKDILLAGEDTETRELYYIISGGAEVQKLGATFMLPSGTFVGEVAYMTGRQSAATSTLKAGSEVLAWDYAALKRRSARSSRFRLALEAMISGDLAEKVSLAVAPSNLTEIMQRRQGAAMDRSVLQG